MCNYWYMCENCKVTGTIFTILEQYFPKLQALFSLLAFNEWHISYFQTILFVQTNPILCSLGANNSCVNDKVTASSGNLFLCCFLPDLRSGGFLTTFMTDLVTLQHQHWKHTWAIMIDQGWSSLIMIDHSWSIFLLVKVDQLSMWIFDDPLVNIDHSTLKNIGLDVTKWNKPSKYKLKHFVPLLLYGILP